ncbi:MAG TPA: cupin domain-containing protein, partial [Acidimicrobiales bacterium]|nr:cupin domain-containing protein [Acidimicrobiales bacterium]
FQHAGVEFIHILEGTLEYGYGSKRYTLSTGDTMQLHGEVTHGPTVVIDLPIRFLSLKVHPMPEGSQ